MLGFVSLLMDLSSEMVHSLLPMFLVGSLGLSVFAVGLIEGIAESTALVTKVFSGVLSDHLRRRKGLAVLGYALGACAKPFFALAQGAGVVIAARFVDRVGKGIRGAPRDALVADLVPAAARGAAYGLRQALDTVGAFLGPLVAAGLMVLFANDFRAVFWVAVIPGALAVALLVVGVREPAHPARGPDSGPDGGPAAARALPIRRDALAQLGAPFWWVVGLGALFTLARFSEAFLVLKAEKVGIAMSWVPLVMVAMNLVYAASAYPFGKLADRLSRRGLLAIGLVFLIAADAVLAMAHGTLALLAGVALWGLHMGMTQGLFAALVADAAPAQWRGTAFGVYNLVSGLALLAASVIAGLLWDWLGPGATFIAGAGFASLTLLALATLGKGRLPCILPAPEAPAPNDTHRP